VKWERRYPHTLPQDSERCLTFRQAWKAKCPELLNSTATFQGSSPWDSLPHTKHPINEPNLPMKFTTSSPRSPFATLLSSCCVWSSTIGRTISLVKFSSNSEKLQTAKRNSSSEISSCRLHVPTISAKIAVWKTSMERRVPCLLLRCFQTLVRPARTFSGWI